MKIIGMLYAYERNRNNTRDQLMLLVTNPTDVCSITLDESARPNPDLVGKEVMVEVSISSYRDKPQYYQTGEPRAITPGANKS